MAHDSGRFPADLPQGRIELPSSFDSESSRHPKSVVRWDGRFGQASSPGSQNSEGAGKNQSGGKGESHPFMVRPDRSVAAARRRRASAVADGKRSRTGAVGDSGAGAGCDYTVAGRAGLFSCFASVAGREGEDGEGNKRLLGFDANELLIEKSPKSPNISGHIGHVERYKQSQQHQQPDGWAFIGGLSEPPGFGNKGSSMGDDTSEIGRAPNTARRLYHETRSAREAVYASSGAKTARFYGSGWQAFSRQAKSSLYEPSGASGPLRVAASMSGSAAARRRTIHFSSIGWDSRSPSPTPTDSFLPAPSENGGVIMADRHLISSHHTTATAARREPVSAHDSTAGRSGRMSRGDMGVATSAGMRNQSLVKMGEAESGSTRRKGGSSADSGWQEIAVNDETTTIGRHDAQRKDAGSDGGKKSDHNGGIEILPAVAAPPAFEQMVDVRHQDDGNSSSVFLENTEKQFLSNKTDDTAAEDALSPTPTTVPLTPGDSRYFSSPATAAGQSPIPLSPSSSSIVDKLASKSSGGDVNANHLDAPDRVSEMVSFPCRTPRGSLSRVTVQHHGSGDDPHCHAPLSHPAQGAPAAPIETTPTSVTQVKEDAATPTKISQADQSSLHRTSSLLRNTSLKAQSSTGDRFAIVAGLTDGEEVKRLDETLPVLDNFEEIVEIVDEARHNMVRHLKAENTIDANEDFARAIWTVIKYLEKLGVVIYGSLVPPCEVDFCGVPKRLSDPDAALRFRSIWDIPRRDSIDIPLTPQMTPRGVPTRRRFFRRSHHGGHQSPTRSQKLRNAMSIEGASRFDLFLQTIRTFKNSTFVPPDPSSSDSREEGRVELNTVPKSKANKKTEQGKAPRILGLPVATPLTARFFPIRETPIIGYGPNAERLDELGLEQKDAQQLTTRNLSASFISDRQTLIDTVTKGLGETALSRMNDFEIQGVLPLGIEVTFGMSEASDLRDILSCVWLTDDKANPAYEDWKLTDQILSRWMWLHGVVTRFVNDATMHKMRYSTILSLVSYNLCGNFTASEPEDKTWAGVSTQHYNAKWKMWDDSRVAFYIDGHLSTPLADVLCLLYEGDYHKLWIPFLAESKSVRKLSDFSQIITHYSALPWPLHDRETMLMGAGSDCMLDKSRGSIMLSGASVPVDAGALWGSAIKPPAAGVTRMELTHFAMCLTPDPRDRKRVRMQLFLYVCTNLITPPRSLQNIIGKTACAKMFGAIKKWCDNIEGSVYEERQKENSRVYDGIREKLDTFYNAQNESSHGVV